MAYPQKDVEDPYIENADTERYHSPHSPFFTRLKWWALGALGVFLTFLFIYLYYFTTPQQQSYWLGRFVELPSPPANSRLQLGVSTEDDGTVFINYILWEDGQFIRRDVHYTSKKFFGLTRRGGFQEAGGYQQKILDGEILSGGIIVDQKKGILILPNGYTVEGKSGHIFQADGQLAKQLKEH